MNTIERAVIYLINISAYTVHMCIHCMYNPVDAPFPFPPLISATMVLIKNSACSLSQEKTNLFLLFIHFVSYSNGDSRL